MMFTPGICAGYFSRSGENFRFSAPAQSKLGISCVRPVRLYDSERMARRRTLPDL